MCTSLISSSPIVIIGDLQIKPSSIERSEIFLQKCTYELRNMVLPPSKIVFLGNILSHGQKLYVECLNMAIKIVAELAKICPVVILVGNKDMAHSKRGIETQHWMQCLKWMPNVMIVDTPVCYGQHAYIPYTPSSEMFIDAFQKVQSGNPDITHVFCHQEFRMPCIHDKNSQQLELNNNSTNTINNPCSDHSVLLPETPSVLFISGYASDKSWLSSHCYYPGWCLSNEYSSETEIPKTIALIDVNLNLKNTSAHDRDLIVQELDLHVPRMIEIRMPIQSYVPYKLRNGDKARIVLRGTLKQIEQFRKTHTKSPAGTKIVFDVIGESVNLMPSSKKYTRDLPQNTSFLEMLRHSLVDDPMATKEYEIFFCPRV